MTVNPNAPSFILAAVQRMYPDLPDLVGADWAAIKPQVDILIARLEATPDAYLASIQLVDLLAQYEPANQRFAAEAKLLLSSISPGGDEGGAIAEAIHDVAPGADVAFYAVDGGQADFIQGIDALAAVRASVIVDDVGILDEPFYQVGLIDQAVDSVKEEGIPYFSSAGNDARQSYEELSEQEASVFRGMIQAGKVNLTEADILLATNKEREQYGLAALSMTQVQYSLTRLIKIKRIEKGGDKYSIIERRYEPPYRSSGISGE